MLVSIVFRILHQQKLAINQRWSFNW